MAKQQKKKHYMPKVQQSGLNNFTKQTQPAGNTQIKSTVTVPTSSQTHLGVTQTLPVDFKQPVTPYNSVLFGKPLANIAKSFQNYSIQGLQFQFKPTASGIAPGNYLATILQPGQFEQIFGNGVQGFGSFFSTLLQTGRNIVSSIAKPARMVASAAISKAAQLMYPSSTNEVLATNGDFVISQNTQLSALGNSSQQPFPPLLHNSYAVAFYNMKPSGASTSYNDPVAFLSSSVVNIGGIQYLSPTQNLLLLDNPISFTIFPTLSPGGSQPVSQALRVKSFSGLLTVAITVTGPLPVSWTSNISLYCQATSNPSLRHSVPMTLLSSRRFTNKGVHTSQIAYRLTKQIQVDDSLLYLSWLPTSVYPITFGSVNVAYSFASVKQMSVNDHLIALDKCRQVRQRNVSSNGAIIKVMFQDEQDVVVDDPSIRYQQVKVTNGKKK